MPLGSRIPGRTYGDTSLELAADAIGILIKRRRSWFSAER
jgi:hypothetical protein